MMNARKTKKRGLLKYALIIPIALVMLVVSNMQEMIAATRTFVEKVVVTENVLSEAELNLDAELQQQKNKVKFTEPVITRDEDVKIYDMVEEAPSFPGGVTELYNWLGQNIVYPVEAQEKGIQGRVTIQFVITETGKVLQPKVVRSLDPLLDAEAIRVVNTMPDWIPGKQGGKAVNVRYILPVQFKLVDNEPKMTPVEVVLIKKEVVSIKKDDELSNKNVYDMVDTPPVFPGGEMELYKWLSENIVYPVEAQEKGIQGRVTIQFVITETGKVIQPKVVRSLDPLLDAEALRVVSAMPNWIPGKQGGKAVNVRYTLPAVFKLVDNKPKNTSKRDVEIEVNPSGNTVIDKEMTQPVFLGGEKAMWRWLAENMKYPIAAQEVGVQGNITVQFFVDENGKPTNPTIHESKLERVIVGGYGEKNKPITKKATAEEIAKGKKALEKEAIRVASAMPNFIPGTLNGKATKMQVLIPIMFKLR